MRRRIFLADDDSEDRSIIQNAMELLDAPDVMQFANDGEELLELLDKSLHASSAPCLIVLDLNMPKINGTQTLGRLKNDDRLKHIPVIIYSTSINPVEREKCLSLGAHSFITKPISFKECKQIAQSFLDFCSCTKVD